MGSQPTDDPAPDPDGQPRLPIPDPTSQPGPAHHTATAPNPGTPNDPDTIPNTSPGGGGGGGRANSPDPAGPPTVGGGERSRGDIYHDGTLYRWNDKQQNWQAVAYDNAPSAGGKPELAPSVLENRLRQRPGLSGALRDSDELRSVFSQRPKTFKSVLDTPEGSRHIEAAIAELAQHGPVPLLDREELQRSRAELTPEQRQLMDYFHRTLQDADHTQPGFDQSSRGDVGYRMAYLSARPHT